jgi:hypothetical protein
MYTLCRLNRALLTQHPAWPVGPQLLVDFLSGLRDHT